MISMKIKFRVMPAVCLIVGGMIVSGCGSNNTPSGVTTKLPADPAVDRSDIESLNANAKPAKTHVAAPPVTKSLPTERELGVAIYPNAKPYKDSTGVVHAAEMDGMRIALMETPDSVEKVTTFYKQEMPKASVTNDTTDGKPVVRLSEPTGKNGLRAVEIAEKEGKTQITLTHVADMPSLKPNSAATPEVGNLPTH